MSPNDDAGRVHKEAFLVSSIFMLVVSVLAVFARVLIRLRYQKRLYADDFFLLFGLACLCAGTGIAWHEINSMYMIEAMITHKPDAEMPKDVIARALEFHKMVETALTLAWTCVFAIKFSFLFFFRSLTDKVCTFNTYWWSVSVLTVIIWIGGILGFWLPCPWFTGTRGLTCGQGSDLGPTIGVAVGMTVGDILTDALSQFTTPEYILGAVLKITVIAIPLRIISQVRIKMTQKLALSFSLCLSVMMIIVTIIRASGLKAKAAGPGTATVDVLWEAYWQLAESWIAVTMVCVTAFRSLFVQTTKKSHPTAPSSSFPQRWYTSFKRRFTHGSDTLAVSEGAEYHDENKHPEPLPNVPSPVMTGLNTFINNQGKQGPMTERGVMESHFAEEHGKDHWTTHETYNGSEDSSTLSSKHRRSSNGTQPSNVSMHRADSFPFYQKH